MDMAISHELINESLAEALENNRQEVECLKRQLIEVQEAVGLNMDPISQRASRAPLKGFIGSLGWWGGAVATAELIKFGLYLTGYANIPSPSELAMFAPAGEWLKGTAPWIIGCSIGGEVGGKFGHQIGFRVAEAILRRTA